MHLPKNFLFVLICQNNPFCKIKKILAYSKTIQNSVENHLKKELEKFCDNALISEFDSIVFNAKQIEKLLEEKE